VVSDDDDDLDELVEKIVPEGVEEESGPAPGADDLVKLLAFDPVPLATRGDFLGAFRKISETLMNSYTLEIASRSHRIAEVEYYFCGDKHMDIFTHQDVLQESSGNWYFHRTGKGYKGGSFKGLDITFGQKGFGGILIRAIVAIDTDEYIEGPCNCVNHILTLNRSKKGIPEISEFVEFERFDLSVTQRGRLFLKQNNTLEQLAVVASPRVGLTLKKTDGERTYFLMKNYRFMSHPLLVRKGRVNLVLGLYADGKNAKEIQDTTGCGAATIKKYLALFDEAKGSTKVEEYAGKALSIDDLCMLCGMLEGAK